MKETRPKIESRAGRLLQGFDEGMYVDYSRKTRLLCDESKKSGDDIPSIRCVEREIVTGDIFPAFYVTFDGPVYITLTNPLSLFRNISGRGAGKKGSEHFFYRYGLVPVYFATMNTMSVLKLYREKATKIFDPDSTFFEDRKCIELSHKKGPRSPNPVKFSSLNIIEQSTAKGTLANEIISNWFYDQYFTRGFWLQPRRGFVPATHMEFGNKMNAVFKLSKSIYTIDRLRRKESVTAAGKRIDVYGAIVRGVWVDTLEFGPPFDAKIEASILDELTGRDREKLPLLNGIMMEIRDREGMKEGKFEEILTVSAGHGKSYSDMIQLASGMLCYRVCIENSAVSRLLPAKKFRDIADTTCRKWMKELNVVETPSGTDDDAFRAAIDKMFPMIMMDESSVYFTNPAVIGFLKKWNLIRGSREEQGSVLLLLLPLLDRISKLPWKERTKITREGDYKELARLVHNDPKFTASLIKLVRRIHLSNLIRKTYQTDFSQPNE